MSYHWNIKDIIEFIILNIRQFIQKKIIKS